MPRYKILIEYDGAPFAGWQYPGQCAVGAGRDHDGDRGVLRREGRWCRAPAAPTPACMRSARSRMSISPAMRETDTIRDALNAHLRPHPVAILSAEKVADDFDARLSAMRRHYLYRIVNRRRRSRARARPRLAGAAPARCRRRCTTPRSGSSASTTSPPSARPNARPNRRRRRSTGSTCRARGDEIHVTAVARSFLHNQVRSMVGSLVLVGDGKWSADDLAARARRPRPRGLRAGGAAGRALSGAGGLLSVADLTRSAATGASAEIIVEDFPVHRRQRLRDPSTGTRSSMACMVWPTRPNSTTGQ